MFSVLPLAVLLAAHPSLYFEPGDLPGYQASASSSRAEIASTLEQGAAQLESMSPSDLSWEPDRGASLITLSVTCMLSGDATLCQTAHRWVTQAMALVSSNGAWETNPDFVQANYLKGFAMAYDILSDARLPSPLTAAEQSQLQALIAAGCKYFYDLSVGGQIWYTQDWSQNHNWTGYGALGVAALSLLGEVPDAQTWLNHAVANYQNIGTVVDRIVDGTWHEGYSYGGGSIATWLWFTDAIHHAKQAGRLASVPDFTASPWFHAVGHYRALGSLPGKSYQHILLHGDFFGWASDEVVMAMRAAASILRDGEAAWQAQQQLADKPHHVYGPEQDATALEFLAFDPTVQPTQPAATDYYLADLAGYITRSGYDPNAMVLAVKAGAFGGLGNWNAMANGLPPGGELDFAHDHVDDLGFWFYGNGEWLAPEASGYVQRPTPNPAFPIAYNTNFHNSITVDGTGQIGDGNWAQGTTSSLIDYTRQAQVVAHLALPDLTYAEMEGTHLYPGSLGLNEVRRQVLFVNRQTVVVRDQLESSAAHTFEWNSHAMDGAVQDGSWIRGVGKNDQALGVRVLSPANWTFRTDEQSPQMVNDQFDPDGNITHFVVATATPGTSARFLVAMEPTTSTGWATRPDIQPLDANAPQSGWVLADGSSWIVGDAPNASTTAGGLTLTGTAGAARTTASDARYTLVRGTALQRQDLELLSGDVADGIAEAWVHGTQVDVQVASASRLRVLAPNATSATWNGGPVSVSPDPADHAHVFIPGLTSPPMDAGTPPPPDAGIPPPMDAGSPPPRTDAGTPLHFGVDAGAPGAGSGAPAPGHRARSCSASGAEPWVLAALALIGLLALRRGRHAP